MASNHNNDDSDKSSTTTTTCPKQELDEDERMTMHDLLKGYGNVLDPNLESHQNHQPPVLPAGTVMSLPGSVVHAGPACSTFRAVLFFSGSPAHTNNVMEADDNDDTSNMTEDEEDTSDTDTDTDNDEEESNSGVYDPDTQYSSVTLCAQLIQLLWPYVGVGERLFLLQRLLDYMRITTLITTTTTTTTTTTSSKCQTREDPQKQEPWRHMSPCRLASFMEQMSVFLTAARQSLTKAERRRYSYFIRKASNDNGLCQILLEPPPAAAVAVAVTPSPKKRPCSNHGSDSSSTTKKQKKEPCPTDLNPVLAAATEVQLQDDDDDDVSSCGELELAQVNLNEYRLVSIAQGLES
jgi:hypothetical protein